MNILAVGLFVLAVVVLLQVHKMRDNLFLFFGLLVIACSFGYAALVLMHIAPVLPVLQTLLARR